MIDPYITPQDTLTQRNVVENRVTGERLNTLVIAQQFEVLNVNNATAKLFKEAGDTLEYTDSAGNKLDLGKHEVDEKSVTLYGENLVLYREILGENQAELSSHQPAALDLAQANEVFSDASGDETLPNDFDGRSARVGDMLRLTLEDSSSNEVILRRHITGFSTKPEPSNPPVVSSGGGNYAAAPRTNLWQFDSAVQWAPEDSSPTAKAVLNGIEVDINGDPGGALYRTDMESMKGFLYGVGGGAYGARFRVTYHHVSSNTGEPALVLKELNSGVSWEAPFDWENDNADDIPFDTPEFPFEVVLTYQYSGAAPTGMEEYDGAYIDFIWTPEIVDDRHEYFEITGDYQGNNRTYFLEVIDFSTAGDTITVRVYDSTGEEPVTEVVLDSTKNPKAIGTRGLSLFADIDGSLDLTKVVIGDVILVKCIAESSGLARVLLDAPLYNALSTNADDWTVKSVEYLREYTGVVEGGANQVTVSGENVVYANGLTGAYYFDDEGNPQGAMRFLDDHGSLKVLYRAVQLPDSNLSIDIVFDRSDIVERAGEISTANEAAYALHTAVAASAGRGVYYLQLGRGDAADFAEKIKLAENSPIYYALNVVTDNDEVRLAAKEHAIQMSAPEELKWRRVYLGVDSPGRYTYLETLPNGAVIQAKVENSVVSLLPATANQLDLSAKMIREDDIVAVPGLGDLLVQSVLSPSEVLVKNAPADTPPGEYLPVKFIKPDTPRSQADYLIELAKSFSSDRAILVWVEDGMKARTRVSSKFVASEIAGLRTTVRPQQGLTFTGLHSIDSAPAMYGRYSRQLLDEISSHGIFVVAQQFEGGEVYVRHQLTTDTSSILAYEDSAGVVGDVISYRLIEATKHFKGRRNVTARTIEDISEAGLRELISATNYSPVVGEEDSLLVYFEDAAGEREKWTVEQHPQLLSRIRTYVKVGIPVPLNGIDHVVDKEVAVIV